MGSCARRSVRFGKMVIIKNAFGYWSKRVFLYPPSFLGFLLHIRFTFVAKTYLSINTMTESEEIITQLIQFRDERDWGQFHNAKDLALAISIEAGELLELFLWKEADAANREKVKQELADIFSFAFLLAEKYQLNVKEIVLEKIKMNAEKYPVDKAKGTATKYTEL